MQYEFGIVPSCSRTSKEKCCKTIFSPRIARYLLKMGNKIVDIKPDKKNSNRTLFVFEVNDKLKKDIKTLLTSTAE